MGERRVLELWLCPECGDHSHFDRWKPEPPACLSHIPPVRMVRVRALVLDDAAIEDGAKALYEHKNDQEASVYSVDGTMPYCPWDGIREDAWRDSWRADARAVLGLPHPQEPRP